MESSSADDTQPLRSLRYGLAKEIQLFPDSLVFVAREEGDEQRFNLANIRRLSIEPGERVPSKLIMLLELDDGNTVIAAEGMTNVRAFREMLPLIKQQAPHIVFEPEDLSDQLQQALINRRQTNFGCYGVVLVAILVVLLVCGLGQLFTHH